MTAPFDPSAGAGDDPHTAEEKRPTEEHAPPHENRDGPARDPDREATEEDLDLDLDIHEQGDGDRLKEGFTGQER